MPGAVIGAVYIVGLPAIFGDSLEVALLTSGMGLLLLLLYLPGGLVSLVFRGRDLLLDVMRAQSREPAAVIPARGRPCS